MGLGISATDWRNMTQDYVNSRTYAYKNAALNGNIAKTSTNQPTISQATGNTCTDGVDDGDIGVGGLVSSFAKGVGKSFVNTIKGCFTDKNGKFSLKKTLISAGAAALCCAFPAVGVAACALGVVSGGVNIITGLKNASEAKTDAAKKDALENIGDGTFTAITSAIGLKASVGAVKATSTAGGAVSKLSALDDNASIVQRLGALGKDMISSTKNNGKQVVDLLKTKDIAGKAHSAVDFLQTLKSKASIKDLSTKAVQEVKNTPSKLKEINLEALKGTIKKSPLTRIQELRTQISPKAQAVLDFLKNTDASKSTTTELVQKFGYDAVMEVLKTFAGYRVLDESV